MSVLGSNPDVRPCLRHVRFTPNNDQMRKLRHVRSASLRSGLNLKRYLLRQLPVQRFYRATYGQQCGSKRA
jgi:hypothetical protein